METRFCLICDKEFTPRAFEDEFCSQDCMETYEEFAYEDEVYDEEENA